MTQIIAEIGVNWFGDIGTAKQMIHESSIAGADAVKFQIFNEYTIEKTKSKPEIKNKLVSMMLGISDILELMKYAHQHGLRFGASVMYPEAFNWLNDTPLDFLKIRFADRRNIELKNQAEKYTIEFHIPLLVSTKMNAYGTYDDVYHGANRLYCLPKYPPRIYEINLELLKREHFSGYSNHYPTPFVAMLAVARELDYVEVHVKEKRTKPVDSAVSINFDELNSICRLRNTMLGMYPNKKVIKSGAI